MKTFSERALRMQPSAIREMTKLSSVAGRDLISFAGGMPNPATFPLERLAEIAAAEVRNHEGRSLQYGLTTGFRPLVQWICEYVAEKGINTTPENVVCTAGSQQAIDLIAEILLDEGDFILVEKPTYLGALAVFVKSGASIVTVRQDHSGVDTDDLETKLAALPLERTKLIYIISNFQNPSGISLSAGRRKVLPSLLEKYNAFLIEDDPYGEIYFGESNRPPEPVSAVDSSRIFYLGTASKLVAPTFRTGWVIAEESLIRRLEPAKEAADLCGSMLDQRIVHRFCSSPEFAHHLDNLRVFYEERHRVMREALEQEMPDGISWTSPTGGFFIWLTLPESLDSESFLQEAITGAKVSYVIGRPFTPDNTAANCLRLAFSVEEPDRIREGIARLARVIRNRM